MSEQTTDSPILIEDNPRGLSHIRLVTINRPERRNALDGKTAQMLHEAIAEADSNKSIRAVVITGAGDHAFCSGADLSGIFSDEVTTLAGGTSAFGTLLSTIQNAGVPVISAVNGIAVGGGFGIVLASDLVVLSSHARLGTPEVRRGLFAMFISRFVYEVIPEKLANEILLLGETLSAEQAKELHIANRVVAKEDVLATALGLAERIAEHSGSVLRMGKRAIRRQRDMDFAGAIEFLGDQLTQNLSLEDATEGITAFFEKRKPVWKDR
jgi:enoyl-CoA hydratase/carnithine racemase